MMLAALVSLSCAVCSSAAKAGLRLLRLVKDLKGFSMLTILTMQRKKVCDRRAARSMPEAEAGFASQASRG